MFRRPVAEVAGQQLISARTLVSVSTSGGNRRLGLTRAGDFRGVEAEEVRTGERFPTKAQRGWTAVIPYSSLGTKKKMQSARKHSAKATKSRKCGRHRMLRMGILVLRVPALWCTGRFCGKIEWGF